MPEKHDLISDITAEDFPRAVLQRSHEVPVVVDFWAAWCGPCRSFAPVYDKVSEEHPDIVFAKVDTEAEQELAGYFQIRSIPTLMVFRDQIGIYSQPGALPEAALESLVEQAQAIDMDDVRRQIAEHTDDGHEHDHEAEPVN
jgi:thioredoxin 1